MPGLHDYHMHSYLCGHGDGAPADYAARAVALGLDEIGVSEHIPMYWLPEGERDPTIAMPEAALPRYLELVEEARRAAPGLPVRLGLEADFIPGQEPALQALLARYPWDYVLGSVHFIGRWGFDDPRYVDEFARRDVDAVYEEYFSLVEQAAQTGLFDTMAHLDLVKKFGHRPRAALGSRYARLARALAACDVCVELNTAGLLKPVGEIYPHVDLIRALRAADVPVTLGSDAHSPTLVGYEFGRAARLLREAGYERVVRFEGRRRSYAPLP
jgi:histidinol-phosphatase (PHP family)